MEMEMEMDDTRNEMKAKFFFSWATNDFSACLRQLNMNEFINSSNNFGNNGSLPSATHLLLFYSEIFWVFDCLLRTSELHVYI